MSSSAAPPNEAEHAGVRRRLLFLAPLAVVFGIGAAFAVGLTLDPRQIPSELIGRPAPAFELLPVQGRSLGLSSSDLVGEVSLVNVFASWCTACRAEHPLFMELARTRQVPIHGLNYKDKPNDAAAWLDELGDPYTRTGADLNGRVGIDWGVYGVPETFVVGADGRIAYKHIGPVTPEALRQKILPIVENLRQRPVGAGS